GLSSPLGATVLDGGVNFSLFSRTAAGVELLFFDREDDAKPSRVVTLDPVVNRSYYYWHVFVPGVRSGQIYAYRVEGPFDPARGRPGCDPVSAPPPPARGGGGAREHPPPAPPPPRRRHRGHRHEERGGRFVRLRLGGRRPAAAAVCPDRYLRGARPRFHPAP